MLLGRVVRACLVCVCGAFNGRLILLIHTSICDYRYVLYVHIIPQHRSSAILHSSLNLLYCVRLKNPRTPIGEHNIILCYEYIVPPFKRPLLYVIELPPEDGTALLLVLVLHFCME